MSCDVFDGEAEHDSVKEHSLEVDWVISKLLNIIQSLYKQVTLN